MSELSKNKMGTDGRPNVLPIKPASGPGFLGPNYSPADEMLPPAAVGVRRGVWRLAADQCQRVRQASG